jgi:hypothetical protein
VTYSENSDEAACTVPLKDILRNESFQVRQGRKAGEGPLDWFTAEQYAGGYAAGDRFPPVLLARWKDALVLVDGWHRMKGAEIAGKEEIAAKVVAVSSLEELLWLTAEANLTHGKRLYGREHREVFRRYIRAGRHQVKPGRRSRLKSYRDIAKDLHGIRRHTTIQNWMQNDFPQIAGRMGTGEANKSVRQASDPEQAIFRGAKEAASTLANATKALSSEERRGELVQALLDALVSTAGTLTDEDRRGAAIATLRTILEDLKSKPYREPPPPGDVTDF